MSERLPATAPIVSQLPGSVSVSSDFARAISSAVGGRWLRMPCSSWRSSISASLVLSVCTGA